jgi:Type II secretion system (T2SS), protein E, N-terminal domain
MEQSGKAGLYASFPGGFAGLRRLTFRGAVLEDRDPLPIGSRLHLTLHLGRLNVSCVGLVKRSILGEGMTVEFVDMSATDRTRLLEYIIVAGAAENRARLKAGLNNAARAPAIAPTAPSLMPASKPPAPLPRFAELLVRRGVITADQLAAAAAEHRQSDGRFCAVLLRLGLASDEDLAACFSEGYRIPLIDLTTVQPTRDALRLVPYELAERHEILPIGVTASTLTVATSDPSNLEGRDEVKFHSGCDLRVTVAPSRVLRKAIQYFYQERAREAG